MTRSKHSTEYIRIPVTVTQTDGTLFDPTGDTVEIAGIAVRTEPVEADWHAGTWETGGGTYYARLLVGPEAGALDFSGVSGSFTKAFFVRVTDSPEVPVLGPVFETFT